MKFLNSSNFNLTLAPENAIRSGWDEVYRNWTPNMGNVMGNPTYNELAKGGAGNLIGGFPVYKAQFSGPALFLKGQKSSYVSKKGLIDINKYFPSFTIQEINEAGHWPHFEQPRLFQEKLINFLD